MRSIALALLIAMPLFAQEAEDATSTTFAPTDPPAVEYPEIPPAELDQPLAEEAPEGDEVVPDGITPAAPDPEIEGAEELLSSIRDAMETPVADADDTAPPAQEGISQTTRQFVQAVVALCVVLGMMLFILAAWNRWGKRTTLFAAVAEPDFVKRLGRVSLDAKTVLHFLRVKDRVLVVAVGPAGVTRVADLPDQLSAPRTEAPSPFLEQLNAQSLKLGAPATAQEDDEIASLKQDLERLQDYLRETAREVE